MASSSKKKKRKRADFQKVKLKLGRKIPKSLNETKTSFKAKKIQIRNQLGTHTGSPSENKRKITIEEFVHGIKNVNITKRKDALAGLQELFISSPEDIHLKLSDVISHLAKLMEDKASEVRSLMFGVLKKILFSVSKDQLYPNFPIIVGYLNCAMTHLEGAIQKDSLEFLDFLTENFPDYVISSYKQILKNFLEQISHSSEGKKYNALKGVSTKRTLIVNPSFKMTSEAWHLCVFQKLQKFLKLLIKKLIVTECDDSGSKTFMWSYDSQLHVDTSSLITSYICQDFFNRNTVISNCKREEDSKELYNFISNITPLLFETWMELDTTSETGLPLYLLQHLNVLMEILNTILEYIEFTDKYYNADKKKWFTRMFEEDFVHHFASPFPFSFDNASLKNQNGKKFSKQDHPFQITCDNLNLMICHIFFQMASDRTLEKESIWENVVIYLSELLNKKPTAGSSFNINNIIDILETIVRNQNLKDIKYKLIGRIFAYYKLTLPGSNHRRQLEIFFSQHIQSFLEDPSVARSIDFIEWMNNLPKLINNQEISWEIICLMKKLAPLNNEIFLTSLQKELASIIEILQSVKIQGIESTTIQRAIVELLLWIPHLSIADFLVMSRFLTLETIVIEVQLYFIQIINNRYHVNFSMWEEEASSYISFILHLLIGIHSHELSLLRAVGKGEYNLPIQVTTEKSQHDQKWSRCRLIIKEICNGLHQFQNIDQIKNVISTYLDKLLDKHKVLPLSSAWSVFELLCYLQPMNDFFILSNVINKIGQLSIASMVTECIHEISPPENLHSVLFSNNELSSVIFALLSQIIQGISNAEEVILISKVILKFIQARKLSFSGASFFREIYEKLKVEFGAALEDSAVWHSLIYELQIQSSFE